jgi:signal transduction histidine kinase
LPKENRSEKKLLLLIKIIPIVIILLFALVISISTLIQNKIFFEKEIKKIQTEHLESSKQRVKEEVNRVYLDIIDEKRKTESKLKENIKHRVEEAHAIASRIYKENSQKPKEEITKLIKSALRDIRFNNDRGYYFVYETTGENILLPPRVDLEGKNLWELQDAKGEYTIRNLSNIVKTSKAGFYSWWWYKPGDNKQQYKKIGYAKYFEPFDWFIGTGEYVKDFEEGIKENLLQRVHKLRYGKNGYVFIVDKEGVYLSHVKKKNIGVNRIDLTDPNGFKITREILKVAKDGKDGYVRYIGTIKPSTGKPAEKITYIRGYKEWDWAIGSGTYISDLNEIIKEKELEHEKLNEYEIKTIIILSAITTIIFIILSMIFTKVIQKRFLEYQKQVKNEMMINRQKDEIMFQQSKSVMLMAN